MTVLFFLIKESLKLWCKNHIVYNLLSLIYYVIIKIQNSTILKFIKLIIDFIFDGEKFFSKFQRSNYKLKG